MKLGVHGIRALAFIVASLALVTNPNGQAADFAFQFQYGCDPASPDILDTSARSFTRWWHSDPPRSTTLPFSLPDDEMAAIAEAVETVGFFDYPADFKGLAVGVNQVVTRSPLRTYRLEVRSAGQSHFVSWSDSASPLSEEAERLQELFRKIVRLIDEHPVVKRLAPRSSCE